MTDESLIQQAKVWRQLGEVSMDQRDLARALEAFRSLRDILGELYRRNPRQAQFVFELGNAQFWVGYVHLEAGEFDLAENAMNDYLAWAYHLNEIAPGKAEWLIEKSYAHTNEITRELMEDAVGKASRRTRYAYSLSGLANVARSVGLVQPAIENVEAARDIPGQLSLTDPSNLDRLQEARFAGLVSATPGVGESCTTRAIRVRQAILSNDQDVARELTASLLASGHFEPGFIRSCRQYGFCRRGG